ncbi:hypothetical protein [Nitrosovibrio sp. Nv17]|uniref:hypothetical protein n=1 Tax=Nitrosovibrio sp. Nv17 TaxID=1855339 RepID=UPI0009087F36|nr:hypothetical protein [Nitrosovibrio sp. Nv17]SFW21697.1 hypothetical protein SAMN05216414_10694 [Nitrosovibrio sp. Nv17]
MNDPVNLRDKKTRLSGFAASFTGKEGCNKKPAFCREKRGFLVPPSPAVDNLGAETAGRPAYSQAAVWIRLGIYIL